MLFKAFSYETYTNFIDAADRVNDCNVASVTYYFDLAAISAEYNVNFEIVSPYGFLTYTSSDGSAQSSSHFSDSVPEYESMKETDYKQQYTAKYDNFEIRSKLSSNTRFFIYSRQLDSGELLHMYSPVADVENIVSVADKVYSSISIAMILFLSVAFFIIVTRFTKPVMEINDITKDMAALNFERKCGDYGKDEIGELGRSINILSNTLDSTLMDLKEKNEVLEKDIERRHALDNARKSFISNVSHELKTPIAIISGYAEGLCDGISSDPEVIKDYCNIIKDESQKMNSLVVELLELSKLDSGAEVFAPESFDLGEKVTSLLSHLSLQFEKNGIRVENKIPPSLMCYAQKDKIEIVLKNYLTNAASHCSGEKKIILRLRDRGTCWKIAVYNSGEHIAPQDMPEIWDSFYRADKAHERSENRFGLGLSIVKSIMTNHKCRYGAENLKGGVEFSFEVAKDSGYYEKNKQ